MSCGTLDPAGVLPISPTGLSPCLAALPNAFGYQNRLRFAVRTPGILLLPVWPLPRSLATTDGISVDFFSSPYLDVSVQAVPHMHLWIQCRLTEYCSAGFPHSEICGSTLICSSPQLIAACRVLLRLSVPRHSPCALHSLTVVEANPFRSASGSFAAKSSTALRRLSSSRKIRIFRGKTRYARLRHRLIYPLYIVQELRKSRLFLAICSFDLSIVSQQ